MDYFKKTHAYFINMKEDSNGNHEIHKEGCRYLSMIKDKKCLGEHISDREALKWARLYYFYFKKIDGCAYCCLSIHKR